MNNLNIDGQEKMQASLKDLLILTNGLFNLNTWFYCGSLWIYKITQDAEKAKVVLVDQENHNRITLFLELSTKVKNYE
jgi:hypothetical protein